MKKRAGKSFYFSLLQVISIILTLIYSPLSLSGAIPSQERAALIALYNNTDGGSWRVRSGWKNPPLAADGFAMPGTENTWYGITCNAGNTAVIKVSLHHNNLNGSLPAELGNLVKVSWLWLVDNHITGNIPAELENMNSLIFLFLGRNQLSGSIPPQLGNMQSLRDAYFDSNQLTGSIPPELGNMSNLQYIDISSNQLSGSIPPQLGNAGNMSLLNLSSNQLTGSIPPELGNLKNLHNLYLSNNQLTGNIPPELANLPVLFELKLSSNPLSGSIPPGFGNLKRLYVLNLSRTQISGNIPPQLGNMSNLSNLNLSESNISGNIPPELGNLSRLKLLTLSRTQLGGSIPPELGKLVNLYFLCLSGNKLNGTIPAGLGNLTGLLDFRLNANQLSGNIPPELKNLTKLERLYLSNNHLTGSIPPGLSTITSVRELLLESNQLSGQIPSTLINLQNLDSLNIRWNALYTNDDFLRDFLNSHQAGGNWEGTQTIAPIDITATAVSNSSIKISWTPILYTGNSGGYRVYYSDTHGGPYTYSGQTADKTASSLTVTGLVLNTLYYFVVESWTGPHEYNQNTVYSEWSSEVSATTTQTDITISGRITCNQKGLTGVTVTLSNGGGSTVTDGAGNYSVAVNSGWSGAVTPAKSGYSFTPANRSYANLTGDQTNQDYTSKQQQGIVISGTITFDQKGLAGVIVTLSNGVSLVTGDDGKYSFVVDNGWSGTLTPSKVGYFFSPGSRSYSAITSSKEDQDFKAVQRPTIKRGFKKKIQ